MMMRETLRRAFEMTGTARKPGDKKQGKKQIEAQFETVLDRPIKDGISDDALQFAENFRPILAECFRKKMTLAEVSRISEVHRQTLHGWAWKGTSTKSEKVKKFCAKFGIVPESMWEMVVRYEPKAETPAGELHAMVDRFISRHPTPREIEHTLHALDRLLR